MPYARGDVVWAPDAFHDDDTDLAMGAERPWLVVGNERFPHHGAQYLCCALTHNLAVDPDMIRIEPHEWTEGGTRKSSQIDHQTIMTIKHAWGEPLQRAPLLRQGARGARGNPLVAVDRWEAPGRGRRHPSCPW